MNINEEQVKRIRELEEELSSERLDEVFFEVVAEKSRIEKRRILTRRILIACLIFAVLILLFAQFFALSIVRTESMEPALDVRDCVVIAKKAYVSEEVGFMDIIALNADFVGTEGVEKKTFQRVIGLPGDVVEVRDGNVYRNGARLHGFHTAYGSGSASDVMEPVTVPERRYFLMNDDSYSDFVAKGEIWGKVVFRLLPVSKAGKFIDIG
ncbi:hypothetical protein AGMMS49983_11250 [Clostridia bacterium]|nr:hypothetical protein AGMMS49983_11250 [Clostridia bacterium]